MKFLLLCASLLLPAFALAQAPKQEATPTEFPGAETFVYREGSVPMRLFVVKPAGWKAGDRRPALMFFFGGGWTTGTPQSSLFSARFAAEIGLVGIAPDYRTKGRHDVSPLGSVADSRAALRWVQDHAGELGLDPARIPITVHAFGHHELPLVQYATTAISAVVNGQPQPLAALPAVEPPFTVPAGWRGHCERVQAT